MAVITRLKTQKNQKRVNLYLDSKFIFGLSLEEVIKNGLFIGQRLTEEQVEELFFSSHFEKLYNKVLNFLSYRPRSEKEITDYLKKNLFTRFTAVSQVKRNIQIKIIKKLKKLKLIDDFKFASWFINQRMSFRPRGKRFLSLELRQKGIEREIINSLISKIPETSQINGAKKIIHKKLRIYKNLPKHKLKQKLFSHLARRGFDFSLIKKVIDEKLQKR